MKNQHQPEIIEKKFLFKKKESEKKLVVYNDNVNTFEHVIDSLMEICGHAPEQAEQCSYIIHYQGKCVVKNGSVRKIKVMCTELLERGLQAGIE